MVYFAAIGFGYMLIQIGLLQRFSVYIGHPTYTLAIVLFSMLLFTGAGSLLSSRCPSLGRSRAFRGCRSASRRRSPSTARRCLATLAATVTAGLGIRTLAVSRLPAPLADAARHVLSDRRAADRTAGVSPLATGIDLGLAWAWGVNGAFSVLASIVAVAISMWIEIDANFWIAASDLSLRSCFL